MEVCLEVNTKETKYMIVSRYQNIRHYSLPTDNKSFENLAKFKFWEQG
jgi:hypothetical protein